MQKTTPNELSCIAIHNLYTKYTHIHTPLKYLPATSGHYMCYEPHPNTFGICLQFFCKFKVIPNKIIKRKQKTEGTDETILAMSQSINDTSV